MPPLLDSLLLGLPTHPALLAGSAMSPWPGLGSLAKSRTGRRCLAAPGLRTCWPMGCAMAGRRGLGHGVDCPGPALPAACSLLVHHV